MILERFMNTPRDPRGIWLIILKRFMNNPKDSRGITNTAADLMMMVVMMMQFMIQLRFLDCDTEIYTT